MWGSSGDGQEHVVPITSSHLYTLCTQNVLFAKRKCVNSKGRGGGEGKKKPGRRKGTNVHSCKQNLRGAPQTGGQHKAARLYLVYCSYDMHTDPVTSRYTDGQFVRFHVESLAQFRNSGSYSLGAP
jgi:hypothetical protein